ncbi:MAG TPA: hypothetical protein VFV81_02765, partial [Verrucomicrobiae bacterium]|nr:hypothetical protein [Verrucomicrobiae bacterium]
PINAPYPSSPVPFPTLFYLKEADIRHPAATPVFTDGNWQDAAPTESDSPSRDLWKGTDWLAQKYPYEMGRVALQRHGSIKAANRNYISSWQTAAPAGAVNATMWDGHAELVRLPDLWSLEWHKDWAKIITPKPGFPAAY